MAERDRLRWQCRRGLLELDLLLQRFLERHYDGLDGEGRAGFALLLQLEDNDLWELLTGRRECADPALRPLVELLRDDS